MTNSSQSVKQRKRSILFWVFVVVSVPLIIGVVGYASGYRFNTHSKTLTVTSLISVSTIPENATITLNSVAQSVRTPFMQSVEPGEYTITATLDGYQPWSKQVTIAEGKSAVFVNVQLFAVTPTLNPATSVAAPVAALRSLTANEAADFSARGFTNTGTLALLDTGTHPVLVDRTNDATWIVTPNATAETAARVGTASSDAQWSPDGTALAFMNPVELWVYDVATKRTQLIRRQRTALTDLTWSTDSTLLFVSDRDAIAAIERNETGGRQRWVLVAASGAHDLVAQKNQLQFTVNGNTFVDVLQD